MKKTGLAVFFVLVILLGLLAGQLGIAHLPWSSEDADTAPAQAVTEQAAEAPARDGEVQATDSPDNQVNLYSGCRSTVKRRNNIAVA